MCVIRICGQGGEFLQIALRGRSHPACTDYWDGNWLRSEVEVAAGGFRGYLTGVMRTEELNRFYNELCLLQELLHGTAEFKTMEGWLSILVVGDGRGHLKFECELQDEPGTGNTLNCELDSGQTFVPPILAQLDQALHRYPVLEG